MNHINKFNEFDRVYLIEGELVDTYGGDYTWRDVWYTIEDGEYIFWEKYIGAKSSDEERITDSDEIEYFRSQIVGSDK
jgi:hypothetical protein